jgi:hypothetical protein
MATKPKFKSGAFEAIHIGLSAILNTYLLVRPLMGDHLPTRLRAA